MADVENKTKVEGDCVEQANGAVEEVTAQVQTPSKKKKKKSKKRSSEQISQLPPGADPGLSTGLLVQIYTKAGVLKTPKQIFWEQASKLGIDNPEIEVKTTDVHPKEFYAHASFEGDKYSADVPMMSKNDAQNYISKVILKKLYDLDHVWSPAERGAPPTSKKGRNSVPESPVKPSAGKLNDKLTVKAMDEKLGIMRNPKSILFEQAIKDKNAVPVIETVPCGSNGPKTFFTTLHYAGKTVKLDTGFKKRTNAEFWCCVKMLKEAYGIDHDWKPVGETVEGQVVEEPEPEPVPSLIPGQLKARTDEDVKASHDKRVRNFGKVTDINPTGRDPNIVLTEMVKNSKVFFKELKFRFDKVGDKKTGNKAIYTLIRKTGPPLVAEYTALTKQEARIVCAEVMLEKVVKIRSGK